MRKHFLQTLLVVVLSVIGVSQCWAANYIEPFSYVGRKTGECAWEKNPSISYDRLIDTYYGTVSRISDATYGEGYSISVGTTAIPDATKSVVMMLTSYTHSVEPYTKVVLTYKYKLSCYDNQGSPARAMAYLYKFDDKAIATSTEVDFIDDSPYGYGSSYRLANVQATRDGQGGWKSTSEKSTTFEFDNLTGTSAKDISKYLMLVLVERQHISPAKLFLCQGAFKCTDYKFTTTYAKVITFDANGGSGSMSQQVIETSGNLTTNFFTRLGYTFNGWNTQADGKGTAYADGAEITATESDKGAVTLYAQWKRTVTLDAQSGTVTPTSIEVNCYSTYSNLPTPTRTGYTFKGWFDAPTGGKQYTTTTASTDEIPATLYAQWTAINYTITYNSKGGSAITDHLTYTIETPTFALPVPEKNGYDFGGWFTNEACTGGYTTQITNGSTGNKTFYAKWNAIVYNITYNVNGGSEITEHKTYTIETATFALPVPTKDGYTFGGWFTNEECTEGQTTQIDKGSIGNKEFYAKWSENVVSDGTGKTLTDAADEVNTALETWVAECKGGKAINLTINRTIYKDGYYNTLCLPFDMSAAQIAETFGDYKELKQFQSATVQGIGSSRSIVIEVENATEIEAGKAYLISFEKGTNVTTLTFNQVVVSTTEATNESGTLAYQGILAPYQLPYEDQDYLFLGANNTLYWAINDGTFMKGFRAYFKVNTNSAHAPYRVGMRAAFGSHQTPTDLSPAVSGQEVRKLLEQGRVVIVNKGVKYNMNGTTAQ